MERQFLRLVLVLVVLVLVVLVLVVLVLVVLVLVLHARIKRRVDLGRRRDLADRPVAGRWGLAGGTDGRLDAAMSPSAAEAHETDSDGDADQDKPTHDATDDRAHFGWSSAATDA